MCQKYRNKTKLKSKQVLGQLKHIRCINTEVLNKKIYLIYDYLSFEMIYLKDCATIVLKPFNVEN